MKGPDTILELTGYSIAHQDETEKHFAFPIRIAPVGKKFWVEYGEQVWTGLDYVEAAEKLGESIMHALACDSQISNE